MHFSRFQPVEALRTTFPAYDLDISQSQNFRFKHFHEIRFFIGYSQQRGVCIIESVKYQQDMYMSLLIWTKKIYKSIFHETVIGFNTLTTNPDHRPLMENLTKVWKMETGPLLGGRVWSTGPKSSLFEILQNKDHYH